ncbi:MAG: alpha/beta fold hydrolase [Thermoanaerobaculia bacterium]
MLPRLFELATSTALVARGLRAESSGTAEGWTVKGWRGGNPAGEPWVLLHGLGATAATYLPLLPELLPDCDILLPELSTLGGTHGPGPAINIPQATRALAELIERRFGGRPVTLAGISLGGWIAVRLALARPDLVQRLLLVVPGGYREQDWGRIGEMVRVESYRDSAAIWGALFARPPLLLRLGRPLLYLAYRSSAVKAALATLREEDAFGDAELATLKMPAGLIWGDQDQLFLRSAGEQMARAIPGARFESIERAGHGVQWEQPRKFLAAVRSFRRDLPLS